MSVVTHNHIIYETYLLVYCSVSTLLGSPSPVLDFADTQTLYMISVLCCVKSITRVRVSLVVFLLSLLRLTSHFSFRYVTT